jgi:adenosylhomocysteinase
MKNGAIMANAGHFDVEINKNHLNEIAQSTAIVRKNIEEFVLENGNRIYLLAEGRLVNLAAGDGHPTEIMDLSFALQTIAVLEIAEKHDQMENKVYNITDEMNEKVAGIKLRSMGIAIDTLSDEQYQYLHQA